MEEWECLLQRLREEFLSREKELQLLHDIDVRILSREESLDATLAFIADETCALIHSTETGILLRRSDHLETVYSSAKADIGQLIPISKSITGRSLLERRAMSIPDLNVLDYRDSYVPLEGWKGTPLRSLLAVPIILDGVAIGVLNSESTEPHAFSSLHERLATAISAQVGLALQHAQLFDQGQLFASVDQLIFADDKEQPVLQVALEKVLDALLSLKYVEVSGAQILFFSEQTRQLEVAHSTNPYDIGITVSVDDSVCGRAIKEQLTIIVGDVRQDPNYKRMLGAAIQSEIAVPIFVGAEEAPIGVLNVESTDHDAFGGFYRLILVNFARRVTTLIALAKLRSDVTEALELRHASDLLVAVGDQTSNLVHRLNNTVGAIRVRAKEVQRDCAKEVEANEFLRESLDAMIHLADKTLEMPKKLKRFLAQQSSMVDLNLCVQNVLADVSFPANVDLQLRLGEGIPPLSLFSFDIVVQNLIRNALDAMPHGGTVTIATSLIAYEGVRGGYAQLTIADTGVGMSRETRSRIFDINFSTKPQKEGKGLGLGLWWVRNFIRRARGEIEVRSSEGVGTEFIVKLPLHASIGNEEEVR